jgi:serine/threonine protein kinase/Tol biopolymer transport system component
MNPDRWRQIEQLYHAAMECTPDQRAAFLRDACPDDDTLRREVESLLAQEKGADGLLEAPALEAAAKMFGEPRGASLIGRQLGNYQVMSLLGVGGMGEVYQAHDTKLGRDVAIKILPPAFVHDAERLARFQREAKLLAALNHPNIATIHGLEESGGVNYLVMELVAGQTLAERIRKGALPLEEALNVAKQIAEALEAAHEKGVIHRDLKPANVKVTPEGRVKVLDFGLAKAFSGDGGQDLSQGITLSEEGKILGTPAYMSPEQARGVKVDKRTDIWAFGCLLYELLTGQPVFGGETLSDTLAGVLKQEPNWQALSAETPAKVRDLLRHCLQKDKTLRMRDAGDAQIEIQEALAAPATAEPSVAPTARGFRSLGRHGLIIGLGVLVLCAAVTGLAVWNLKPAPSPPPRPASRFSIDLPPGAQLMIQGGFGVISPDGNRIVYVATQGGTQRLYLRDMDSQEARPVPGTEVANIPFFSPDGQWLGFFAGGKLKKVSVNGGSAITLCDAANAAGASWSRQGTIVFGTGGGLMQVSDAGGTPQAMTHLEKGESAHLWPEFLPDGKAVLFMAAFPIRVAVYSLETGKRRDLIQGQGATAPHYLPSGYLVYAQAGGSLMAAPFDAQRLRVTGAAVPVAQGVLMNPGTGLAQYSISDTGSLVYVSASGGVAQGRLVWVDRKGVEQPLPAPPRIYWFPRLSPDGQRVAVTIDGRQIWLCDLRRDTLTRWTFTGADNRTGIWTPDGKRIAFLSNKDGPQNIYWQRADGSGGLERLTTSQYLQAPSSWSPDGQALAFLQVSSAPTGFDIWVLQMGDHKAQPFVQTPFTETAPVFSPDGHWLAYVSDESGRSEIYVQPYPGPGGKYQISTEGGTEPVWNPKGRELFYRQGDKMMAVEITTQPSFSISKPRMLFEGPYLPTPQSFSNYDVSADGQRFLVLKPAGQAQASTQINIVLNWTEELKHLVSAGTK